MIRIILLLYFLSIFSVSLYAENIKKPGKVNLSEQECLQKSSSTASDLIIRPLLNTSFLREPPVIYKYNEPADLIELVPILRDINRLIPRRFSFAEHQFILSADQMTIQHQYMDERTKRTPKNSFITFSYDDTAGGYDANVEVPLFYCPIVGFSGMRLQDWSSYPLGNYTMKIRRSNIFGNEERLYIKAQTKF